jgi:uncharacterized protein (TIGR02996 family)
MTDRDALFAAVHAAPLDDAPRLILADWLDEHVQPQRAEFIRLQVAQRREYETHGRTARLDDLFVRARSLFYQPWAESVRSVFGREIAVYSRGFPTGDPPYAVSAECLVTHLPAVATWIGPETEIRVEAYPAQFNALASVPELSWIRNLAIQAPWRNEPHAAEDEIAGLVASPYLANLRSLTLTGLALTDATALALRNARALTALETLGLRANRIGRAGAIALADAPHLASLRHLDLANNRIGNAAVKALLKSPHLAGLESLDLNNNPFTVEVDLLVKQRFPDPQITPSVE